MNVRSITTTQCSINRLILSTAIYLSINGCNAKGTRGTARMENAQNKKSGGYFDGLRNRLYQRFGGSRASVNQRSAGNLVSAGNPISELLELLRNCGLSQEEQLIFREVLSNQMPIAFNLQLLITKAVTQLCDIEDVNSPLAKKYISVISELRKRGLNIDSPYSEISGAARYHNTMLMSALSFDNAFAPTAILALLSDACNANPFIPNIYGQNALHLLLLKCRETQRCIVTVILNRKDIKEHIDDVTACGDTAMHIACARRDKKYITELLEKGARLDIKNHDGQTPINLLYLNKEQRLDFLIKGNENTNHQFNQSTESILAHLATIDNEIFNSDPHAIEINIKRLKDGLV